MGGFISFGQSILNNNNDVKQVYRRMDGLKGYVKGKKNVKIERKPSPESLKIKKATHKTVWKNRLEYTVYIGLFLIVLILVL